MITVADPMTDLPNVQSLSFEDALKELEILVRKLEEGRIPLQEAILAYERGTALQKHGVRLLEEARLKVEQIHEADLETSNAV